MLYLDNSATTKVLPEVVQAMLPYLEAEYGNPSSKYYPLAVHAKQAIDQARTQVATLLNCQSDEIIFTSGATESNNWIIKGVCSPLELKQQHFITSQAEHTSVLMAFQYLETLGATVTYLPVDEYARISVAELQASIQPNTKLVSLIWANNELGSLNEIEKIAEICTNAGIELHVDATQLIGKGSIDLQAIPGITYLSLSAHKFYGPKGIGVAFIRKDDQGISRALIPLLHGSQEKGYRGGTQAVHDIVGLGKAAELANERLEANIDKLTELEVILCTKLKKAFGETLSFNSDTKNKVPGVVNIQIPQFNNEILLKELAPYLAASTGSACSSTKPSHVLKASGHDLNEIRHSVRFSLSPYLDSQQLELFEQL
ncbi:MAG: cysteine desulfurase family protein [Culicoidibacterales bacterium]